jgi:hypothetical protein
MLFDARIVSPPATVSVTLPGLPAPVPTTANVAVGVLPRRSCANATSYNPNAGLTNGVALRAASMRVFVLSA